MLQLLQGTVLGQSYGAYAVVLREEFGWSKTLLSGASALREMESGITGPVQGWVLDRFGARRVATAGIVTLAAGLYLFSRVQTPLAFYVAFVVMALGASMMGYLTLTYTVVQWFERRRATALSLTAAGGAILGVVGPDRFQRETQPVGIPLPAELCPAGHRRRLHRRPADRSHGRCPDRRAGRAAHAR